MQVPAHCQPLLHCRNQHRRQLGSFCLAPTSFPERPSRDTKQWTICPIPWGVVLNWDQSPAPALHQTPCWLLFYYYYYLWKWYPEPSRAGWGQEFSVLISSVREERRRQPNQELLHCASVLPLQTWVPPAKRYHWPRTLTEVLWIIILNSGLIRGNCDLLANILQAVKWSWALQLQNSLQATASVEFLLKEKGVVLLL